MAKALYDFAADANVSITRPIEYARGVAQRIVRSCVGLIRDSRHVCERGLTKLLTIDD